MSLSPTNPFFGCEDEEGACGRDRSESQLSEYDPDALTRRMSTLRLNPTDAYHIADAGIDDSSHESQCELARAQAAVGQQPPPCRDHFGHVVTPQYEEITVYPYTRRTTPAPPIPRGEEIVGRVEDYRLPSQHWQPCSPDPGDDHVVNPYPGITLEDYSHLPWRRPPEPITLEDYTRWPEIHTPEHSRPSLGARIAACCSETFCAGCPNSYAELDEAREMDAQAGVGGGTFAWEGHDSDQQPMVIDEPGDWAPDAPQPRGRCSIQ